jgi:hypothetical protein
MDQRQLSTPGPWFRPDISFLEINLENMYQVRRRRRVGPTG